MRKKQFEKLCNTFGDQSLDPKDRWKSIKYIFIENPIVDVQLLLKQGGIRYSDDSEIGPGFYIIDTFNNALGIPNNEEKLITFIQLSAIDKISLLNQ